MSPRTVAIVGAGFSGALTALHLLARADGPSVTLIERSGGFGPGLAYGACRPEHLLNVRAGNMSAFPDRPDHFVDWLRAHGRAEADRAAFAPRTVYGDYLRDLLEDAAASAPRRLRRIADEAVVLTRDADDRLQLRTAGGLSLAAEAVVLALGSPPPPLPQAAAGIAADPRYIPDPWAAHAFDTMAATDSVFLLGTGLTMVDVVLDLERRGHRGPVTALSRRGLIPRRHRGPPPAPSEPPRPAARLSRSLHRFRRDAEGDWRAAVDSLRPLTRSLWSRLEPAERSRFLRHLRPFWDVHRHRLAPQAADTLDRMVAGGGVRIVAGKLSAAGAGRDGLTLDWRARGAPRASTVTAHWLVNCTGPEGDLTRTDSPLLRSLLAEGLIRPDPLRLGLDVDDDCRAIGVGGQACPDLLAVGPLTRGAFWEISAVPDIRVQAAEVAAQLAARSAR